MLFIYICCALVGLGKKLAHVCDKSTTVLLCPHSPRTEPGPSQIEVSCLPVGEQKGKQLAYIHTCTHSVSVQYECVICLIGADLQNRTINYSLIRTSSIWRS